MKDSFGQLENLLLNKKYQSRIERQLAFENPNFHSSIRPYKIQDIKALFKGSEKQIEAISGDSLVSAGVGHIKLLPQININSGVVITDAGTDFISDIYTGIHTTANIKNKLTFGLSALYATQQNTGWEAELRDSLSVFQGWGESRNGGLDRQTRNLDAYISYSPDHIFNIEIGKGKHFLGDGINSLFLSNNAISYPYFKLNTKVWHINYVNLFGWHKDISPNPLDRDLWNDKYTATHYLSWNVSPVVNIALFETIIWAADDSLSRRGFDLNYINPIIFYRPVEFAQGSADNAIIGLSMKYIATEHFSFYGQWSLDEFLLRQFLNNDGWWGNKFGLQLGMNYFDAFSMSDLSLKTEFNLVRPYTYSHGNVTQNYAHKGQPLAHPLGANFYNLNLEADYIKDNWYFSAHVYLSHFGRDTLGTNSGGNIFQSYLDPDKVYGNSIGQGIAHNLYDLEVTAAYILSKKDDFRLFASLRYYHLNQINNSNDLYFRVGVRIYWPDHL
ncbi:MAG: hypothetical protein HKN39_04300 [Flavobacteriales bacterium]|nr:hypothetical protein [Flavobacteriales bacterium]